MKLMQVNITSKWKDLEKGGKDKETTFYKASRFTLTYQNRYFLLYNSPLTNVPLAFKRLPNYI